MQISITGLTLAAFIVSSALAAPVKRTPLTGHELSLRSEEVPPICILDQSSDNIINGEPITQYEYLDLSNVNHAPHKPTPFQEIVLGGIKRTRTIEPYVNGKATFAVSRKASSKEGQQAPVVGGKFAVLSLDNHIKTRKKKKLLPGESSFKVEKS